MKKLVRLFFGVIAAIYAQNAEAQSFTFTSDTVFATVSGSVNVHNDIRATGSNSMSYIWKVTESNFPESWKQAVGVCDNNLCYNGVTINREYTSNPFTGTSDFKLQFFSSMSTADNGKYYMTVNVHDPVSHTMDDMTFVISKFPTSVGNTTKADDAISLYPNPASNELNVFFSQESDIKNIAVYNLIGKPVIVYKVTGTNSARLNIENMPSGVYFVRLIDGRGRVSAIRKFTHL